MTKDKKKILVRVFLIGLVLIYSCVIEHENYDLTQIFVGQGVFLYLASKLLIISCCLLGVSCIEKLREKNLNEKRKVIFFFFFLLIYVLFYLFLKTKGIIGSELHYDMNTIYDNALQGKTIFYQGWYSTVFYNVALMLMPSSYGKHGIVLLQLIVFSYIAAYVSCYFLKNHGKNMAICCSIIFIIPPMLFFSQFTMRETWFAFSLTLLCVECDRFLNNEKNYLKLCLCSAVTSIFRPEGIYVAFVIIIFLIIYNKINRKEKCRLIALIVILLVLLNIPQKNGNEYRSTPFINPLSNMIVTDGFKWCNKEDDEKIINKVIDVEALKKYASLTDLRVIHEDPDAWKKDYTDEEYSAFVKTYIRLVLKNPYIFIKVRFMTFWYTITEGTYSYGYFSTLIQNSNVVVKAILAILYNSLLPLVLLVFSVFLKRNIKSFLYALLVGGEACAIFILGTQAEYMFHFTFLLGSWIALLLIWGTRKNV